jgi:hypothetical protein
MRASLQQESLRPIQPVLQKGNDGSQRQRKEDKASMRCFNCKEEGHLVSDCPDPRCCTCAIQFATFLADRKEHEKVVHKRQKKKCNNDTIASIC